MKGKGIFGKYSKITIGINNKLKGVRNVNKKGLTGAFCILCASGLVGGIVWCKNQTWKDINDESISDSSNEDLNSNNNSEIIVDSDIASYLTSDYTSDTSTSTYENSTIISIDDVESVYKKMTAEDVITLSDAFCKYLNEFAKLSDKAYVFSELKPGDLYSIIYLSNIDNINKEETQKLIDADIINENIKVNIVNAFKVSNLIRDDVSNKMITAYNNKEKVSEKDFIDLSLILTDEDDIEAFKVMSQIMVEAVNNPETRKSNYKDLVYYYIMGENLYDDSYDYSKSVFKTDRSSLTVGGDYLLRNMAYSIIDINKAAKTDNARYNKMLDESLSNVANIMQVFDDKCSCEEETSKTLVK